MSLLGNQVYANPAQPVWQPFGTGGGGPTGPTGPAGSTGPTGSTGSAGATGPAGVADILVMNVVVGTSFPGGYAQVPSVMEVTYTNSTSMTLTTPSRVVFNSPGFYKAECCSGGAVCDFVDVGVKYAVYNNSGVFQFYGSQSVGTLCNGSSVSCYIQVPVAGWYVEMVYSANNPVTITPAFKQYVNGMITRLN